jgi:excisionase family DNA binding protein
MDIYLTTTQVADLLGVTRGTVTTMAYGQSFAGTRFYRTAEGRTTIRIPRASVEAFIARSLDPDADWDEPDDRS